MVPAMLVVFFLLILIGTPLFISLLAAGFVGFIVIGDYSLLRIMVQQFFSTMDSFSLLAIPLFIFAGALMNVGGLTDRLLRFTQALVGHLRGGLGYVNIVASILFAGVNGSAAADTSALGSILIPAMHKDGYSKSYAAGLTAASSLIGPIIPPSIFMILYANMTNTSVGGLFIAGIFPGLVLGAVFAVMNYIYSAKHGFPVRSTRANMKEFMASSLVAAPALVAPLVIIGGIATGIFTPTESGAVAVVYTIVAGAFYTRELTIKRLWNAICETVRLTSAIFLIIGAAGIVGWLLAYARVPAAFAGAISGLVESPVLLLGLLSLIIFVTGMFMEEVATLVLLTPILAPLSAAAGIDPFHFGVVVTLNITVALITPPMGACIYIAAAVGKVEISDLFKNIWPFVGTAILGLVILILFPPITTFLPRLLGF